MSPLDLENQDQLEDVIEQELDEPPMYKVLLYNDDYTTMDFVIRILGDIFHKSSSEATRIMLNVHYNGFGICGYYTGEIAETKVRAVHMSAKEAGFPLKAGMEYI
ncbi:MAG: ATP-dependent Clp protease adaptor ClpS [Deltaproteobacteria bacterium]|nr:ATP-dependent Clp protease adaptor ClpS [Deltaproteobacteria bacterium]MDL1960739.1 ATP-dependent Clp protease adaptor ClpS [Deltaproteobacteria bacterium]